MLLVALLALAAHEPKVASVSSDGKLAIVALADAAVAPLGSTALALCDPPALGKVVIRDPKFAGVAFEPAPAVGCPIIFWSTDPDGNPRPETLHPPTPLGTIDSVEPELRLKGSFPNRKPLWIVRKGTTIGKLVTIDDAGRAQVVLIDAGLAPRPGDTVRPSPLPDAPADRTWGRAIAVTPDVGETRVTVDLGTVDGVRAGDRVEFHRQGFVATGTLEEPAAHSARVLVFDTQMRTAVKPGDFVRKLTPDDPARIFRFDRDYVLLAVGEGAGVKSGSEFDLYSAGDLPDRRPASAKPYMRVKASAVKMSYTGAAPVASATHTGAALNRWDWAVTASKPLPKLGISFSAGSAFCSQRVRRLDLSSIAVGTVLRPFGPDGRRLGVSLTVVRSDETSTLVWVAGRPDELEKSGIHLTIYRPECLHSGV